MRIRNPNMPRPPGEVTNRPPRYDGVGDGPRRPPIGGGSGNPMKPKGGGGAGIGAYGGTRPSGTRPSTNMPLVKNPPSFKPMGKPMGKPGVKMAMGGTVKVRPTSPGGVSAVRPGENYFSGKAKKFPGKPMLPPGKPTNKLPRVPGGPNGPTNALPRAPGMKFPMGMKDGGMAHGTKAKKGRGLAVMIAIGKPKGRGK